MYRTARIASVLLCAMGASALAQEKIEWKQVINTPKGTNLPKGLKADILGIELGETYAELKAKLDALLAESVAVKPAPKSGMDRLAAKLDGATSNDSPLKELKTIMSSSQAAGAKSLAAEFVGQIQLQRELPGKGRNLDDFIRVFLSAPSSGHQVIGIERTLTAYNEENQFRIAEVLDGIKAKFKAEPSVIRADNSGTHYRFQFNNGQSVPNTVWHTCQPQHDFTNSNAVAGINYKGDCDVVLIAMFTHGISKAHAKTMRFVLADNERTKANVTADFDYIQANLSRFLNQQRGAVPKL